MHNFTNSLIDDNAIKRKIYILEALNNGERLVPAQDLAYQLHCSTRTIVSDMSELRNELPINWEIISVKTKGYILIKPMADSILSMINKYLTESILYKIMIEIFNNRYCTLEKWSQSLYVNKSTLGKYLKNYKRVLNREGLSLNSKSGELQLKGNELNIRHYYSTFFYLTQRFSSEPLLPIELKNRFLSILHQNEVRMDFHLLCSSVFVFINRFYNKSYLTKEMKCKPIYDNKQLKCFNEIIITIEDYYGIQFSKKEKEALDIFLFLRSTSIYSQGALIIDYLTKSHQKTYKSYLNLIDILLTNNTLRSEQEEKLRVNLISYFYKLYIFNENHFSIGNVFDSVDPSRTEVLRNYKENVTLVSNWNLAYNNGKFSRDEIEYIAHYATVILNSFSGNINILFLFSGTTLRQNLIYTKIAQNLGEKVKIHKMVNHETKYDFIITNYQQLSNTKTPVIYISEFVAENEINAIKKRIFNFK
ncbi:helix-turn-helix domain-containing protein [Bacillus pseudomycoides]|uniref:Helix-turn-helix domain-containing protein n=1 Tax=Bacillus bingmayongensis TaxID=1150157 RepID=A0ABU5K0B7_9BACI|nr:helix-turn-helix domain-containing protein [Bacillus pseudomycoides]